MFEPSNSTFTGNSAALGGALAWVSNGTLSNSTFAFNSSQNGGAVANVSSSDSQANYTLYLDSTIIANNTIGGAGGHAADLASTPNVNLTVIGANNLVGSADPAITLPPDTISTDKHGQIRITPSGFGGIYFNHLSTPAALRKLAGELLARAEVLEPVLAEAGA